MYWRIGAAYRKLPRDQNKSAFREIVKRGSPPGLVAFDGDVAVGWCQLTPRDALPGLDRAWRLQRVDQVPVWRAHRLPQTGCHIGIDLSCVKARQACRCGRRRGLSAGCGQDSRSSWTGYATTFKRAGFKVVARHVPARPIMRHALKTIAR